MDRCRCDEYRKAVKKHVHYGVALFKRDVLDNQDRKGFTIKWRRNDICYADRKFSKPQALYSGEYKEMLQRQYSEEGWRGHQAWCPHMSPVDNKKDDTKYRRYLKSSDDKRHHHTLA